LAQTLTEASLVGSRGPLCLRPTSNFGRNVAPRVMSEPDLQATVTDLRHRLEMTRVTTRLELADFADQLEAMREATRQKVADLGKRLEDQLFNRVQGVVRKEVHDEVRVVLVCVERSEQLNEATRQDVALIGHQLEDVQHLLRQRQSAVSCISGPEAGDVPEKPAVDKANEQWGAPPRPLQQYEEPLPAPTDRRLSERAPLDTGELRLWFSHELLTLRQSDDALCKQLRFYALDLERRLEEAVTRLCFAGCAAARSTPQAAGAAAEQLDKAASAEGGVAAEDGTPGGNVAPSPGRSCWRVPLDDPRTDQQATHAESLVAEAGEGQSVDATGGTGSLVGYFVPAPLSRKSDR